MISSRSITVAARTAIFAFSILAITMSCEQSTRTRDALWDAYRDWAGLLGVPPLGEASVAVRLVRSGMSPPRSGEDLSDPRVIVAIWPSGDVVWSGDRVAGGAPYSKGRVDPTDVARVSRDVHEAVASVEHRARNVPDSSYVTIRASVDDEAIELRSWHVGFEQNPKLMASGNGGIAPRAGRAQEEVMAEWTDDYRAFRAAWDRAMRACEAIVPREAPK